MPSQAHDLLAKKYFTSANYRKAKKQGGRWLAVLSDEKNFPEQEDPEVQVLPAGVRVA